MLPAFKTRLGLAQNVRKFTRVPDVAVLFKFGADSNGIQAPRVAPNVPVERVAQEAPVQVHHILFVQLAERRLRTRELRCRRKHLSRKGGSVADSSFPRRRLVAANRSRDTSTVHAVGWRQWAAQDTRLGHHERRCGGTVCARNVVGDCAHYWRWYVAPTYLSSSPTNQWIRPHPAITGGCPGRPVHVSRYSGGVHPL